MRTQDIQRTEEVAIVDNQHAARLSDHRPLQVQVVSGTAYLTMEGDDRDYLLQSGDVLCFKDKGQIVVQGLPFTRYRVLAR